MDGVGKQMSVVERLAHAEFLQRSAHKEGVNTREISADPLSVYMTMKRKMTGVMAQFDCPCEFYGRC